jgi:hypothetical protein
MTHDPPGAHQRQRATYLAIWIFAACGCGTTTTVQRRVDPSSKRTQCTIAEVAWRSADEDYDRGATIDALTTLETVIRDASQAGADEVGRRFDVLFRKPPSPAFLSKWSVEVAIRLRQLACAEQLGTITRDVANERYVQSIVDLEDERAVIIDEMRRSKH